jgi:hypothetical protein
MKKLILLIVLIPCLAQTQNIIGLNMEKMNHLKPG